MSRYEITALSNEDVHSIGRELGTIVPKGSFIALTGERFAGNTHLIRGIAQGLDVPGWAALDRPAMRLMHTHHGGRCTLQHIDFYHLNELPELPECVVDALRSEEDICIVRWANVFPERWPKHNVIEIEVSVLEDSRHVLLITDHGDACPELGKRFGRRAACFA